MTRILLFAAIVTAWSQAGCAASGDETVAGVDCNRTFCGCTTEHSKPVRIRVAESDGAPVGGARLTCRDGDKHLATGNPDGVLAVNIEGQSSTVCGFIPDCEIAYLHMDDGTRGRPFWLAPFLRGNAVNADDKHIELLGDQRATERTLPDPLEAGWNGAPVCEKLHEDSDHRILRCSFPPSVGHERHYHDRHFGYAISGGRMRIIDANGTREVDLTTGSSFASDGVDWHEVLNVGETTVVYLIIEPK